MYSGWVRHYYTITYKCVYNFLLLAELTVLPAKSSAKIVLLHCDFETRIFKKKNWKNRCDLRLLLGRVHVDKWILLTTWSGMTRAEQIARRGV